MCSRRLKPTTTQIFEPDESCVDSRRAKWRRRTRPIQVIYTRIARVMTGVIATAMELMSQAAHWAAAGPVRRQRWLGWHWARGWLCRQFLAGDHLTLANSTVLTPIIVGLCRKRMMP